ncbi:Rieske (2Fe-2S) protein [Niveispirillum sp.]|uniref:Rieske (2Fe-2S) protein n=1 Tax=Niveispirillum sp. TaxID=1917217 RepID=UPI001B621969|nr:Rieske (2Fe-2S) protein [Niveispirillum sp.]MBP7339074.1 Rieske (2Fe-2S) protein [Niveispirillum sp.]
MTGWALLGHAGDLADHGQWITGWIGNVPVVVRNFGGTLRGFRNVCSHRFALMLTEPAGKGPLRCPYHAWVYDADGVPKAIPFNDSDFHLDDAGRRALALPPVGVAVAGGLVFVHLDAAADPALPAGWVDQGTGTLPDGSVISADGTIRHRSTRIRVGAC